VYTYRREIMCRNDLRIKVGRAAKDKFIVHNSLEGVGRNTKSIFTKPQNNHPLLIQSVTPIKKTGLFRDGVFS
jgi:hypothetical protein